MSRSSALRALVACGISVSALIAMALVGRTPTELACPAGFDAADPAELAREFNPRAAESALEKLRQRFGTRVCAPHKLPESIAEYQERGNDPGRADIPPGVLRRAVEQKAAMQAAKAAVPNAEVHWTPYGHGPQVGDPLYPDGYRDGIRTVAGRADSFAYDPVGKRLFVAIGEGGIWMSEAQNGDVGTLADHWVSIGDSLPTQITSAVAWTAARGGRVIALAGDHVQGGNTYVGLGAYWSDDLGAHWHHSVGVPDGVGGTKLAVDLSNPQIVYAATHKGLFRSDDAGETFTNVALPVSESCAGQVDFTGPCQLANVVTDVVIRQPGGSDVTGLLPTQCSNEGCAVLAAVGYRGGIEETYSDGTQRAPGNGLYRSDTGQPGTFAMLGAANPLGLGLVPIGFAPQDRVGRVELGAAEGPQQDHNYVYAIVEDAVLFNKGIPIIDLPTDAHEPTLPVDCAALAGGVPIDPEDVKFVCEQLAAGYNPTSINGVYVSPDFGDTWVRLADDVELTYNVLTGSSLVGAVALGIGPGVQAWYDLWIKPDPTATVDSIPSRLVFGMEELWKNRLNVPVTGLEQTPDDFKVIGTYFAGTTCLFLLGQIGPPVPFCPLSNPPTTQTTTHPDQHDGIYIPDESRHGVWLIVGNDGGVFKQFSGDPLLDDFGNDKWGDGANQGFFTLFHYGIAVAKDGTIYYGNQDNASGKIEPNGRHVRVYVGDGVYTAVDPDNSQIAYYQTPELAIVRTNDGGITSTSISPADAEAGSAHFLSPFQMDPLDANHLVAAGTKVAETLDAADTATWTSVFDLGVDEATGFTHQSRSRALDVRGDAIYVGWCGPCNVLGNTQFQRGIATNVGGDKPPKKGAEDGWHQASAIGLPNRYIYNIAIDPEDAKTVYVVLGGYSTARWLPPGQYEDTNANIGHGHVFVSHDAGEHFSDISGDLPDAVATAVTRYHNQLIVGTDIGAFISSDLQGTSWAPLGDLPNVPISQFAFHPADPDRLFAGTFGRGTQTVKLTPTAGGGTTPPSQRDTTRFGGALPAGLLVLLLAAAGLRRRRH